MSNPGLCDACARRPRGIDGHERLRQDGAGASCYRCEACKTLWGRNYVGSGEFAWELQKLSESGAAD